ncbi:hypothetical protein [Bartonella taylorii]|uniref:hypothetical protein n=1 Tax=Bartonella taylorii TaxID=33046 RepID=UPI001ABADB1D|nr:hypothetical protein [Bartonella taylorii]
MTVKKKYEFTDEIIKFCGKTLHRIRALKDFGDVEQWDLGGFIEHEGNLSHEGNCWIYDEARVYSNARVYGNAKVYGKACVNENACVGNNAQVYDNAHVYGDAEIYDHAHVYGRAKVYGNAQVFDQAHVYGTAAIHEFAKAFGNARISQDIIGSIAWVDGSEKKYELTDETIEVDDHTLYRIRALRDFGDVKKGDLGGWVESEDNLSHEGNCWISGGGAVFGGTRIRGGEHINSQFVSNKTYELSMLTPQQYMASLPWHRRIWERLRYYWEYRIWL